MSNLIKALFINPKEENELLIDNGDGSGVALVIFDPSGSHGAYNFLPLLQTLAQPALLSCEELVALITRVIHSTQGQFELMDIRAHANWAFFVSDLKCEVQEAS